MQSLLSSCICKMPAHLSLAEQEREWRKTGRTAELGLAAISERGRMKMCDTCENPKPVIRLPGPGNTPKLELRDEEDMLPTVAFKERRSFRSLSGLTHDAKTVRATSASLSFRFCRIKGSLNNIWLDHPSKSASDDTKASLFEDNSGILN